MAMRSEKVRLDQKTVGFSALYEVTKILGDPIDLPQGLSGILRILNSFMGMTKGAICLYDQKRRELGRELIIRALKETDGVQVKAAARLGITPRQLAYKMQKYRIIKEFRIED